MASFLHYAGSKSKISKVFHTYLPDPLPDTIVSPFFGSGAFEYYLAKMYPHKNVMGYDIIEPLVIYHQQLIENPVNLYEEIKSKFHQPLNKEQFEDIKHSIDDEQTPIIKALYLFMMSDSSFSGRITSFAKKTRVRDIEKMKDFNLKNVQVSIQDFQKTITQYKDNPDIFFYIDPPYFLKHNWYGKERFNHDLLFELLKDCKGKWMLSYNDSEYIANLYKDFKIHRIPMIHIAQKRKQVEELLITNY